MADLTVKTQAINDTDLFLVQRPSDLKTGSGSNPLYSVSAEDIGIFASNYIHEDFEAVKLEFKDIQNELDMITNQILPTVSAALTNHDIRIKVLEDNTAALTIDLEQTHEEINNIVAKTRIYFYHRLVEIGGDTSEPGEMAVRRKDGDTMAGFQDVEIIEYYLSSGQNIANIFENEVLELTSQRGETNVTPLGETSEGEFITHRAIFNIDYIRPLGNRVEIEVTIRNSSGNGFPVYEIGLLNEVRTDIYPIFTISEEEFETGMDLKYDKTGGVLTGDIIIEKSGTALLHLKGTSSRITFVNALSLTRDGTEILKLEQSFIQARKPINANSNKIINLQKPSEVNEAATKGYVDDLVAANDITEDQLFSRGDAVSGQSSGTTQSGGFFYQSGSLYYKV